jgi:hypothetical protein
LKRIQFNESSELLRNYLFLNSILFELSYNCFNVFNLLNYSLYLRGMTSEEGVESVLKMMNEIRKKENYKIEFVDVFCEKGNCVPIYINLKMKVKKF